MQLAKNPRSSVILTAILVVSAMVLFFSTVIWIGTNYQLSRIGSDYMSPTLGEHNLVAINLNAYHNGGKINRGDIIMFFPPQVQVKPDALDNSFMGVLNRFTAKPSLVDPGSTIKRVIGLPGDKIFIDSSGQLFLNGQRYDEPYVATKANYQLKTLADIGGELYSTHAIISPFPGVDAPIVVPPYSLFLLGDNRSRSEDSHLYGFVTQDRIVGRAVMRYFPTFKMLN